MQRTAPSIADYDALIDPVRHARQEKSGKHLGGPAKAASAKLAVTEAEASPTHLVLRSDALKLFAEQAGRPETRS
jgi:hypothetical protein